MLLIAINFNRFDSVVAVIYYGLLIET